MPGRANVACQFLEASVMDVVREGHIHFLQVPQGAPHGLATGLVAQPWQVGCQVLPEPMRCSLSHLGVS